jgi:putative DNA primase/helicase
MGVAEDPHGQSPREFMDALKQASRRFYGTAVRAFLEHQASSPENILATARQRMAAFVRVAVPAGADGQVYRVAERFALCGAAGELAIEAGVLPWATGAADAVCQRMFGEWLAARGGAGSFEVAQGVKAVHEFIIEQGAACFFDSTKPDLIIRDRVGWIEHEWKGHEVVYIVPSSQWPKLCGGYDPNGVAKALADAGDLLAAESGEYTHSLRTPWDKKKVRCRVLVADSDEEPLGEPWASLTRELSGGAA